MGPLHIYALFVLLLVLASLLVAYNFVRYRFKNDLTLLFIGLYASLFVISVILTLSFVQGTPAATTFQ